MLEIADVTGKHNVDFTLRL